MWHWFSVPHGLYKAQINSFWLEASHLVRENYTSPLLCEGWVRNKEDSLVKENQG